MPKTIFFLNRYSSFSFLTLNNLFNIGVEVIDKEHQRLFKVINKLFTLNKEDANGRFACQEGVKYLVLVRKWGDGFLKSRL